MIFIMGHHLYHIGFEGDYIFKDGWAWVDFYFILTGIFTYQHYCLRQPLVNKQYGTEALWYTLHKFRRFFPATFVAICSLYCAHSFGMLLKGNISGLIKLNGQDIFEVLYLSSSGFTATA